MRKCAGRDAVVQEIIARQAAKKGVQSISDEGMRWQITIITALPILHFLPDGLWTPYGQIPRPLKAKRTLMYCIT
jgi:hypothetical protein